MQRRRARQRVRSPSHVSTECANPSSQRRAYAVIMSGVSHVPCCCRRGPAHPSITASKARSKVTEKRAERIVRRNESRDMEVAGKQDHPRVRTPPQHRVVLVEPREDAPRIGVEQAFRREIAACRQQAIRFDQRRSTGGNGSSTSSQGIEAISSKCKVQQYTQDGRSRQTGE